MANKKENKEDIYLREGIHFLSIGLTSKAKEAFNNALIHNPKFSPAMHNLGLISLRSNNLERARKLLEDSAKINPSVETYSILGECYEKMGDYENTLVCYKIILKNFPNKIPIITKSAMLLERLGKYEEAIKLYKEIIQKEPQNTDISIKLAWLLWKKNPDAAIELLENDLDLGKKNILERIKILSVLILFKEWSFRIINNQLPYHASSINDTFFKNSDDILSRLDTESSHLLTEYKDHPQGYMIKGIINFVKNDTKNAQYYFDKVSKHSNNKMARAIRFDDKFFSDLNDFQTIELTKNLPAVIEVKEREIFDEDILYLSCNSDYFNYFTKPLLLSINKFSEKTNIHIHIMDSKPSHTEYVLKFCTFLKNINYSISVERPQLPPNDINYSRSYFHAIRFIRLYQHLLKFKKRLWLMDVDALFNQSPKALFNEFKNKDISLRIRPARLEPWNQFNACLFGVSYTEKATNYLHKIAAYIAYFYQNSELPWGIDQLAMYASYNNINKKDKPSIGFMDDIILDYEYNKNSILWCSSGVIKFAALNKKRIKNNEEVTPYELRFEYYNGEAEMLDEQLKSG